MTGSGVANPPTPTGDVRFFICKLIASPATCTSGGDAVLPNQTLSPVSAGVASATSAKVTLTSAGRYCFRAEYLGDSNYPAGPGGFNSKDDSATECFVVNPLQPSISTVASPTGSQPLGTVLDDTATLSGTANQPDGDPAGGTITFTAYGPHSNATTCTTVAYTSVVT